MFGIPNLLRNAPRAIGLTLLGTLASTLASFFNPPPLWGVFDQGTTTPATDVSGVLEVGIGAEASVSNYPLEDGTFATYNKVLTPNVYNIRLVRDGTEAQRGAFLQWLQANVGSLNLFDVLTPEAGYANVTLKNYRLSRTRESGAAMIVADCLFQEVRQIPAVYSSSRITNPENQPPTPAARVSPVPSNEVFP